VITHIIDFITKFDWSKCVVLLLALNGLLAEIVRLCPTIPAKFPWLVTLIKILGNDTQRDNVLIRCGTGYDILENSTA
jgi:hypothetical protein